MPRFAKKRVTDHGPTDGQTLIYRDAWTHLKIDAHPSFGALSGISRYMPSPYRWMIENLQAASKIHFKRAKKCLQCVSDDNIRLR